jgi:hypothetical protein
VGEEENDRLLNGKEEAASVIHININQNQKSNFISHI